MTQPGLISVDLQNFIDLEFAKLKQEIAQAFVKLQAQQVAENAAAEAAKP
jgi:hypothetical protein